MFTLVAALLRIVIFLVLAGALAAFIASNPQPVTVSLFPLPYTAETPLHTLCVILLGLGVALGAGTVWLIHLKYRLRLIHRGRGSARRMQAMEQEIKSLRLETQRWAPAKPESHALLIPRPLR